MRLTKNWSSHMAMLIKTIMLTDKPVLEIGSGLFSTPLMHWLCKMRGLKLVTYENIEEYYKFAKGFQSPNHRIKFVKDWNEIDLKTHWGVVLIDHHPSEQRGLDAIRLKDKADYLVLHDSEKPEFYNYEQAYPHFKYKFDWKECKPWTTVLSNFKDLSNLK